MLTIAGFDALFEGWVGHIYRWHQSCTSVGVEECCAPFAGKYRTLYSFETMVLVTGPDLKRKAASASQAAVKGWLSQAVIHAGPTGS
jgi:hypothetical protein